MTVVLVHGFLNKGSKMKRMAAYLRARGWTVHTPSLTPSNGTLGIEALAGQLADFIEKVIPPTAKFDLVGFSMGGIISRFYIQRLGGFSRVQRLITLAAPHHGTHTAYLTWTTCSHQMRPGSAFLKSLNADLSALSEIAFISIWTPLDLMIIPASSSHLPFAKKGKNGKFGTNNEELKIWLPAHPLMVTGRASLRAVEAALRKELKTTNSQ